MWDSLPFCVNLKLKDTFLSKIHVANVGLHVDFELTKQGFCDSFGKMLHPQITF